MEIVNTAVHKTAKITLNNNICIEEIYTRCEARARQLVKVYWLTIRNEQNLTTYGVYKFF